MAKTKPNRGGSFGKQGNLKVNLTSKPKPKSKPTGNHADLDRNARHVFHKPHVKGVGIKFGHVDAVVTDSRGKATRTINMRAGH